MLASHLAAIATKRRRGLYAPASCEDLLGAATSATSTKRRARASTGHNSASTSTEESCESAFRSKKTDGVFLGDVLVCYWHEGDGCMQKDGISCRPRSSCSDAGRRR